MRRVERFEDMSVDHELQLTMDDCGDITVRIYENLPHLGVVPWTAVQFCVPSPGGGRSPRTYRALLTLMDAMEADNQMDKDRRSRRAKNRD